MDKIWESKRYAFEVKLPQGWAIQTYPTPEGTRVADIFDENKKHIGFIGMEKYEKSPLDYVSEILDNVKRTSEVKIIEQSNDQKYALVIYNASSKDEFWQRYLYLADTPGNIKMRFAIASKKDEYEKYAPILKKYAPTLKELTIQSAPQQQTQTAPPTKPKKEKPPKPPKMPTFFNSALSVFVMLLLGAGYIALLWTIKGAALDIPYKAVWTISNLKEVSDGKDVCAEPFCFQTDTIKKKAGLFNYSFCDDHKPELDQSRRATLGYALYWIIIILLTGLLALIMALVLLVLAQPILFLLGQTGILSTAKAFYRLKSINDQAGEKATKLQEKVFFVMLVIAMIIMLVAWVVYLWW